MVHIAIYYHGGFPRYHKISKDFYERLIKFLDKPPWNKCDIVIQVIE